MIPGAVKAQNDNWWMGFSLQEAIFMGFCALLIVLSKVVLRFHLGIAGHSMFFLAFFMLLCRGCVPRPATATLVGLLAGIGTVMLGLGKGSVFGLLNFLVPGLALDLAAMVVPALSTAWLPAVLGGVIVALGHAPGQYLINRLIGMDSDAALQFVALKTLPAIAFGIMGALLVPKTVRTLRSSGLFPNAGPPAPMPQGGQTK